MPHPRPAPPAGRSRVSALVTAAVLALAACTPGGGAEDAQDGTAQPAPQEPPATVAVTRLPGETAVVDAATPAEAAEAVSRALFATAPVVVLAAEGEQLRGASAAAALGVPVLVDGPGASAELERLGAEVALALGSVTDPGIEVVTPADDAALAELVGAGDPVAVTAGEEAAEVAGLVAGQARLLVPAEQAGRSETDQPEPTGDDPGYAEERDDLPVTAPAEPVTGALVLSTGATGHVAALGSARAAGAEVLLDPDADPGATSESVAAVAAAAPEVALALGEEFGDDATLDWRVAAAARSPELPGGGQRVLPGKTYVALYGNPLTSALGVLGEQGPEATIERAVAHAEPYEELVDTTVVPALEIIATVASAGAGADGNYSNEIPVSDLRPLVDLAGDSGQYVVLDLQPGRTDFVTQARLYEELLREPHVGLALDPEWRLGPQERHMVRIGQVEVSEVNEVVDYLAELTRDHDLPQKLLVLHQFQVRMIPGAEDVDQSRPEVAVLIHADGQGPQGSKQDTWRALHDHAPSMRFWGWKNFYDEDSPMLTPQQTIELVEPDPDFISYQ